MGLLFSAIGGAAGAGADILQEDRRNTDALAKQKDYATFQDQLASKREEATLKLKQKYQREDEDYKNSPENIAKEATASEARANAALDIKGRMVEKEAGLEQSKYDAGATLRKTKETEDLEKAKTEFRAKSALELEAIVNRGNDPAYLKAMKNEANAKRDTSGDGLRSVQLEAARLALDEKKAEMKMPPAVKAQAEALREQIKAKTAVIDKAVVDGTANPEGIAKLQKERDALSGKVADLYSPYIPGGAAKPAEPKPSGKNEWDSDTKKVYKNGEYVGDAKTADEARALIAGKVKPPAKADSLLGKVEPPYEPPADSPAGKAAAMRKDRAVATEQSNAARQKEAEQAFSAVGNSREKAAQLQDSPLFSSLTSAQKSQISKLVNAR